MSVFGPHNQLPFSYPEMSSDSYVTFWLPSPEKPIPGKSLISVYTEQAMTGESLMNYTS